MQVNTGVINTSRKEGSPIDETTKKKSLNK